MFKKKLHSAFDIMLKEMCFSDVNLQYKEYYNVEGMLFSSNWKCVKKMDQLSFYSYCLMF